MKFDSDRTEALFEAVPEPVVIVEFSGDTPIVRACNDTFTQQFGYNAESISGESLNEYIVPDDTHARQTATEIDAAAAAGRTIERALTRQTAEGTQDFLFRAAPFEEGRESMSEPFDLYGESVAWVADTGLFIACGRQQNGIVLR